MRIGWGADDPDLTVLNVIGYTTNDTTGIDTVTVEPPDNSMGDGLAAGDYKISVARHYDVNDGDRIFGVEPRFLA